MLNVEGISKKYTGRYVLKNASFTVDRGEILGLLGRNGAGKSTAMNIITGYISASEGSVTFDGTDVLTDPGAFKSHIGYLPEIPPLYADMTVFEYLRFAAEIKGVPSKKRKAAVGAVMKRASVADRAEMLVRHLSKGYRQRVGVAQAILGDPDVVILDEPGIGLDPVQLSQMHALVREIGKEHAVILSSHILPEIGDICNRIVMLDRGRVVACDTLQNLLKMRTGRIALRAPINEAVKETLKTLPGVKRVTEETPLEEGCMDLCVEQANHTDIREAVFRLFARHNCPLRMLAPEKTDLSDVFMSLLDGKGEK